MSKHTCSVEGCQKAIRARELCGAHYEAARREARRAGFDGNSRPCTACGTIIPRTKPRGAITPYCSEDCKPRCEIPTCEAPVQGRGWCVFHYSRWREQGDPEAEIQIQRHKGMLCVADGCENLQRKREWCSSHYNQWRASGEVGPLHFTWAKDFHCTVCGGPSGKTPGRRKYCSDACAQLAIRHGSAVPTMAPCVSCGKDISLTERGKAGRRRRADVKLCRRCRSDKRKHGMSVEELARRDGIDCGICKQPVDLDLRAPNLMRASVDHINPRARGGDNDPNNLQLAHLLCNCIKSDRLEIT